MTAEVFPDKYFPKNFDEYIGNVEIVDFIREWAQKWENGSRQSPVLFFGPPGIGKTSLAYLVAKEMGWQIFEMNASDLRNKDAIEQAVGAAANNSSLFGSKRLILIDEVDSMQSQDRGGPSAIASIIKVSMNPVILTANEFYGEKKLLPLRSIVEMKEFKKINYLSIAKRLREILDAEKAEYDPEAIKELAKKSSGDFRSTLLDIQSMLPKITMEDVNELMPRERKEKIFPIMTKIFKGKNVSEIQHAVDSSEVSSDLLLRWVEENIPRQYDAEDCAKAFSILSRGDIFNGRIMRRQHYGFLKYVYFLSTVGVGLAKTKEYHGWQPFQFPTLLSSLSASSSKRAQLTGVAEKMGKKMHCSKNQVKQDIEILKIFLKDEKALPYYSVFFGFEEADLALILEAKKDSKKVEKILDAAKVIEKKIIAEKIMPKQNRFFG